jgi:3-hydroxyacyl-CoA dehydrogenase/enoyl-CoA hydratase/3-hydroxybutyryl-CoA epimerase
MGVDAFESRAAQLASQYGPGFVVTEEVKAAIRKYEPHY